MIIELLSSKHNINIVGMTSCMYTLSHFDSETLILTRTAGHSKKIFNVELICRIFERHNPPANTGRAVYRKLVVDLDDAFRHITSTDTYKIL